MRYVYQVTEEDVDGCGGCAIEMVTCTKPLTKDELALLEKILRDVKKESIEQDGDDDTGSMVSEALDRFRDATGILVKLDNNLIDGCVTF